MSDNTTRVVDAQRWIVVADSPFLPARGGGEKEHLGLVQAMMQANCLAALVIPTDRDPAKYGRSDDLAALRALVHPAPVLFIPRVRSLRAAVVPWRPYVVGSRPPVPGLVHDLARLAPDATGVVITGYKSHYVGRYVAEGLGLPAVVRMHNMEGHYHRALAAAESGPKSWAMWVESARVDVDERLLEHAHWLCGIADISSTDSARRAGRALVPVRFVPTFAMTTVPGPAADEHSEPDPATVVFVGSLDVGTNADALRWFAQEVWPHVLSSMPHARWQVVGRHPTDWVRSLVASTPRAELHADVADPGLYLRRSSVAVNPAVSGSGVNIKLVEYLAVGVPVVSTTMGMQGVGLDAETHLSVADTGSDFAQAILKILRDPSSAQQMAARGQARAAVILDVTRSIDQMAELLHDIEERKTSPWWARRRRHQGRRTTNRGVSA